MRGAQALALVLGLIGVATPARALIADHTIEPGEHFNIASFRLWVPDDLGAVKGLIVLSPGSNLDGRADVMDVAWQAFAERHEFGLLGSYFTDHENLLDEEYAQASLGSGQAMLDALTALAQTSGHSEVAAAPLLLWGMSAGGDFNYELTCFEADRIIGFVANKGGFYHTLPAPAGALSVPGLFFLGTADLERRITAVTTTFESGRAASAPWTLVREQGVGHDIGSSRAMALIYFESLLAFRLGLPFEPVNQAEGWWGDLASNEIAAGEPDSITASTVWLPDEQSAQAWHAVMTNDLGSLPPLQTGGAPNGGGNSAGGNSAGGRTAGSGNMSGGTAPDVAGAAGAPITEGGTGAQSRGQELRSDGDSGGCSLSRSGLAASSAHWLLLSLLICFGRRRFGVE